MVRKTGRERERKDKIRELVCQAKVSKGRM